MLFGRGTVKVRVHRFQHCWLGCCIVLSDVCTQLFGLCNNSVINVPGEEIARKLILILCRDVQISLLFPVAC